MDHRIACVGDSLTYGFLVENREQNHYPAQLGRLLGEGFKVNNFGENGHTAQKEADLPYWHHPKFQASCSFAPNTVILMLGTNDAKWQNWQGAEVFIKDYRALVQHYQALPSQPQVFLMTPPKMFAVPGVVSNVQPAVVEVIAQLVRDLGVDLGLPVIDLNRATQGRPELFPEDGIHTSAAGASFIAGLVREGLRGFSAKV